MRFVHLFGTKTIFTFTLLSVFFIIGVDIAHAQELVQNLGEVNKEAGLGTASLGTIVARIIRIFFGILGMIAISLCIYAGFKWMTAQGDAKQVDEAKEILKNGIIGLLIIFASFGISEFVMSKLFGATGFKGGGGNSGDSGESSPSFLNGYSGGSALGKVIDWHEPVRNAANVSRNSLIQVKFKFPINPESLINKNSKDVKLKDGKIEAGPLKSGSVLIYANKDGKTGALKAEEVWVTTVQDDTNTMFVFDPVPLLGSASANTPYTVELTSDIQKSQGGSAFSGFGSSYPWTFTVGTQLDLTPPTLKSIVPTAGGTYDRNITIQLTFSEPINLASAVGLFDPSKNKNFDNLSVKRPNGSLVPGIWKVGGGFNIIEFTPLFKCATNSCGQDVFCLPPTEKLEVRAKSGVLAKNANGVIENAQIDPKIGYVGVTDGSNNALDGGGENAAKPWSTSGGSPQGTPQDDFFMAFTTTAQTKTSAPQIVALEPQIYATSKTDPIVTPDSPVSATFDSLMKATSFDEVDFRAKLPKAQAGFWKSLDIVKIKVGGAEQSVSKMTIAHAQLAKSSPYAVFIPSSVQDIYQNCFLPAAGLQCKPDPTTGTYSCCNGNSSKAECDKLLEYGGKSTK